MFDITQKFVSAVDILALGNSAVDDILPYLRELHQALVTFPNMPLNYMGTERLGKHVDDLGMRKASDNLNEDEIRQLKLDLDSACQQFKDVVCQ